MPDLPVRELEYCRTMPNSRGCWRGRCRRSEPGAPDPHRSGRGGGGARAHGDGEPGGGVVGRRHECPRGGRGDGPRGKHGPLACEAHVRQAPAVAAGGPGAACAVAGQRARIPALTVQASATRRATRRNCLNPIGKLTPNIPNIGEARQRAICLISLPFESKHCSVRSSGEQWSRNVGS